MEYFLTGLVLIFAGGLISLIFAENYKAKIVSIFSFSGTVSFSVPVFKALFTGEIIEKMFYLPEPIGKIPVVIDSLSAFFILVISIMSFLGTVYASGYLKPCLNKNKNISSHFLFLSILICSMLGVVTVQNALFYLIVWEIMSLSSFFLLIFENEKQEVLSAGINYLIYMHICVIFLILGFIMLYLKSGSLEFNSFKAVLESNKIFADMVFILLFIGFGTKAGFVPFHNWLPKAHPAAPSHISAIMSGVMIKTGIYGILRTLTLMIPSLSISYFILIISVITALFGILYATAQKDIKKLLAYSSIENIGIIGIGIGLGMLGLSYHNNLIATFGFAGAFLHLLNHSIFKVILFFCAGSVYKQTRLKDMEQLGGLAKKMPYTSFLFLIGSMSISALPPFNGFISEFLIYMGLLKGLVIKDIYITVLIAGVIVSVSFVGAIALLCFTKVFSITFLGVPRTQQAQDVKEEVPFIMVLPIAILALSALLIGLFPQNAILIVLNPVKYLIINNNQAITGVYFPLDLLRYISLSSFAFITMLLAVWGMRKLLLKNKKIDIQNTWGCGYQKINNRMQYSGSSYVSPFLSMLKPFFIKHFDIKKPKELFPKEAHFDLDIEDIEEFYVVKPLIKADEKFLLKFQWIQGGHTQQYILYGLIFLVMALLGTFFIN